MQCFLCESELESLDNGYFSHPESNVCRVQYTDHFGVPVEALPEEVVRGDDGSDFFEELENIQIFPFVEDVLREVFAKYGLERLGGVSTGRGWSAFSTFQRCRYLYLRRYVRPIERVSILPVMEPPARAIGTVIHAFLAVYYTRCIVPDYPLTPELLRDEMLAKANPEFVNEGWRVFLAYALFYQGEEIMPLAVEYDLKDPRTSESCRYDLIAYFPRPQDDRAPGTYVVEHKSSERFDDATLNGWANDGEVIGQVMLWERLGLSLRFGKLKGVIVNLLGKQKEPKFHRTTVAPESWQIAQHANDLKRNEAEIHQARALDSWPRSRANCIGRFGKCDLWDYCATTEE